MPRTLTLTNFGILNVWGLGYTLKIKHTPPLSPLPTRREHNFPGAHADANSTALIFSVTNFQCVSCVGEGRTGNRRGVKTNCTIFTLFAKSAFPTGVRGGLASVRTKQIIKFRYTLSKVPRVHVKEEVMAKRAERRALDGNFLRYKLHYRKHAEKGQKITV